MKIHHHELRMMQVSYGANVDITFDPSMEGNRHQSPMSFSMDALAQ